MPADTDPRDAEQAAGEHGGLPATPGAAARESAHVHDDAGVDEASDQSFLAHRPAGQHADARRPAATRARVTTSPMTQGRGGIEDHAAVGRAHPGGRRGRPHQHRGRVGRDVVFTVSHAGQRPGHLHAVGAARLGHQREAASRRGWRWRWGGASWKTRTAWVNGGGDRVAGAPREPADGGQARGRPVHGESHLRAPAADHHRGQVARHDYDGSGRMTIPVVRFGEFRRAGVRTRRGAGGRGRWCTTASARCAAGW